MRRKVKHPQACAEMKGQRVVVLTERTCCGRIGTVCAVVLDGLSFPVQVKFKSNGWRKYNWFDVRELGWLLECR